MADVTYIPEQNQGNNILPWMLASNGGFGGMNNAWPWLFAMNGGGFGGFGGWGGAGLGGGVLGFILGALVGNNGGFGGLFGGGNNSAGLLANQISGDTGRELIMQAINGTDADVRLLATTLNADVNEVRSALSTVQLAIQNVGSQVGMSGLQVINAIQAGNAEMANQLCKCCCDQRQLTVEQGYQNQLATLNQTNQLGNAISGSGQRTVDAIADLKTTMVKEFCDAKERDMQSEINRQGEIITQLRNEADNARQTAVFASMLSPINAKLTEIESRQPNTVPVQWPALTAVNTTPYVNGGFYGGWNNGFGGWGNGFNF